MKDLFFLCFTVQQFIREASFSPGSVEQILLLYCLVRAQDTWTVVQMTAAKLKPFCISCVLFRLVQYCAHFHFHDCE
jgi:hypothetical protein